MRLASIVRRQEIGLEDPARIIRKPHARSIYIFAKNKFVRDLSSLGC